MKLTKVVWVLCVAVFVGSFMASAAPGPFIRVEQPWNTTLVLAGGLARPVLEQPIYSIREAYLEGYVAKADPFVLQGWWTLGVGWFVMTDWFPNIAIGGGLRFLFKTSVTGVDDTAWTPYVGVGWWWGPFELFFRWNWFGAIAWDGPLGGGVPSFGMTLDLDRLRKGTFGDR